MLLAVTMWDDHNFLCHQPPFFYEPYLITLMNIHLAVPIFWRKERPEGKRLGLKHSIKIVVDMPPAAVCAHAKKPDYFGTTFPRISRIRHILVFGQ